MKIAFIGLGAIGLPMARRLAKHPEIELSLFDIRPDVLRRESSLGRVSTSVADCVAGANAVFTVLPEDPHVRDVAGEVASHGRPGQVFLDFSTIAPRTIEEVAAQLADAGISTLSGALTRSVAAAEIGELSIFIGGESTLVDALSTALAQIANELRLVESLGAAKALKIVNNMVVSALDVTIADVLLVGAKAGVDPSALVEALLHSGADSWPLRNHIAKHLLVDDLGPGRFSALYMAKDVRLAAELAAAQGQPAWFAGVVSAIYRGTVAHGFGEHYHPIALRWLERGANSDPITPRVAAAAARPSSEADAVTETLCTAVVAQQALITFDALRLIGPAGVPPSEAAAHLESGSASNACLRGFLGSGPTYPAEIRFEEMVRALGEACEHAAKALVPGLTLEVGKHLALAHGERYGFRSSAADVVRGGALE